MKSLESKMKDISSNYAKIRDQHLKTQKQNGDLIEHVDDKVFEIE